MPSLIPEYPHNLVSASPRRLSGTASFSRISTGAVLWLKPTTTICMRLCLTSEVLRHGAETFDGHPDQGQYDAREADDRQIRRALRTPSDGQPADQHHEIKEPGHQRPRLFGVPVDVRPPRELGGNGARDDSQREERKPQHDGVLIQIIEVIQ